MFWSGEQIEIAFSTKAIVSDYKKENIDCNAYILTVGEEYFITSDGRGKRMRGLQVFQAKKKAKPDGVLIPTGQFAFLISKEVVHIPNNAMGFISLKTKSAKFRGLVNISGFHVDPGYYGQLIFSVFNAGPSPIHVRAGDPLFMLWIADIGDPKSPASSPSTFVKKQKDPSLGIPSEIISQVSAPLLSLQQMSKKVSALQNDLNVVKAVAALLFAAIGIVIAWMNFTKPAAPLSTAPSIQQDAAAGQIPIENTGAPTQSNTAAPPIPPPSGSRQNQ